MLQNFTTLRYINVSAFSALILRGGELLGFKVKP